MRTQKQQVQLTFEAEAAKQKRLLKEAAEAYVKLKFEIDEKEHDLSELRKVLLEGMKSGDQIVIDVDGSTEHSPDYAVSKEKSMIVDQSDETKLVGVINSTVKGGYLQCLVASFSVEKLHALEVLHPKLAEKVPYVPQYRICVREQ